MKLFLSLMLLAYSAVVSAKYESDYQKTYCDSVGGRMEVVLPNNTRVDCLTEERAIEVDYEHKWAESIGQALHYAMWTGTKATVLLIISTPIESNAGYKRLMGTINHYNLPIDVITVNHESITE